MTNGKQRAQRQKRRTGHQQENAPDAPEPGNAACNHRRQEIAGVVERLVLPHLRAKPARARQTQRNTRNQWPHKRRADTGDNLRDGDDAALLTKPEQQRTQRNGDTKQCQNRTLIAGGIRNKSRRQRCQ